MFIIIAVLLLRQTTLEAGRKESNAIYLNSNFLDQDKYHRVDDAPTCLTQTKWVFLKQKKVNTILGMLNLQLANVSEKRIGFCEFNFDMLFIRTDLTQTSVPIMSKTEVASLGDIDIRWFCEYNSQTTACDGYSYCLTDECNCQSPNLTQFLCPDKSGCIAMNKMCDGVHDCKDGSDECLCEGFILLNCAALAHRPYCISEVEFCKFERYSGQFLPQHQKTLLQKCAKESGIKVSCWHVMKSYNRKKKNLNPLHQCFNDIFQQSRGSFFKNKYDIKPYCLNNCSKYHDNNAWNSFCDKMISFSNGIMESILLQCERGTASLQEICDGKIDCETGDDEKGCPHRFYCSNNSVESVSFEKKCDNVKDCSGGADECVDCDFGAFTSANFLISSWIVFIATLVSGILSIFLNCFQGYECYSIEPATYQGELDRLVRLQVFFFDFLMGLYECSLIGTTLAINLQGNYCLYDQEWRSSIFCIILGILFTFSSHGSLLSIALMSVIRYISCISNNSIHINKSTVKVFSSILLTLNIFNSLTPIVPVQIIQNIFRTDFFFTDINKNPFVSTNPLNFSLLIAAHDRVFQRNSTNIYSIIRDFKTTASNDKIWHTTEISFYGHSGLCVHNIFKNQDSFKIYKISYLISIITLLLIISIVYILILRKVRQSHNEIRNMAGPENQRDNSPGVTTKVLLMIGTQLLSWIPFIGAVIYYTIYSESVPKMVFEMNVLLVLPINSLLNPIFYSGLYRTLVKWIKKGTGINAIFCKRNQEENVIPLEVLN